MQKYQKLFLIICFLSLVIYGAYAAFAPDLAAAAAGYDHGVDSLYWPALVDIRAAIGGVNLAVGIFVLIGLLHFQTYGKPAVLLCTIILSSLVVFRITGLLIDGPGLGLHPEDMVKSYNSAALWFFEFPMMLAGLYLLKKWS